MASKDKKKKDDLLTPGNIILGIIIIVLIGSLFFDFFGGAKETTPQGCPVPIENLIASNVAYMAGDEVMSEDRLIKPEPNDNVSYSISGIFRNIGDEAIEIRQLLLTNQNMGAGDMVDLEEPIIINANSIKTFNISLPRGDYHKIDAYAGACEGNILWHEYGEGSKYAWEIEEMEAGNNTINQTNQTM